MPSDFEKQQRLQLALLGLVLWGPFALAALVIGGMIWWLVAR